MEDGPPIFSQDFSCPDLLNTSMIVFVYGAITLYCYTFQSIPLQRHESAVPLSLAATKGISIDFFSSGYLDVSVLRVRFLTPMYSVQDTQLMLGGFPHSDITGSKAVYRLTDTFRRLPRPSSPLAAKASTVCA